ncbi:sigma-70 family RNA polymerase sigma factor [Fulvivirga sp. M361]|uniref:RNA polymerase sigma factor n=1 Tax=Fulvivirga sp. M361 TaxID=2594266 RepID=UPI00117A12DC|nr:sigma-70 family RNA polymerase sigma factor [Fulvivirga sp. M361]TRX61386.1 sigma-70 family RNA polymerase sigma factor [Fulvivirga sp. M361]
MPDPKKTLCDESEFDAFFKDQVKSLASYLYYRFGDREQAQDIVQETFSKLWQQCAEVPLEKARSFIYTVASNLFVSVKRHDQVKLRYREQAVELNNVNNESPEYQILEKEFMEKLTDAIASLPEKQRAAYLLNRVEKKTYREIAEIMEVSVKAVEKLMHKALKKIKDRIGDL